MLDLDNLERLRWPKFLSPFLNSSSPWPIGFDDWWQRNKAHLSHLPSDLCEQWIHRHWLHSEFTFLPLESLNYRRKTWSGSELLRSIYRWQGGLLRPEFDYKTFQRSGGDDRTQTAIALDEGTWDYPMVLLSTPHGVIDGGRPLPNVRLVIVEGHQRHRYLNALHVLGRPPTGPHETIIVSSPIV